MARQVFFRANLRNFYIQDAVISFKYRSAPFGENGYAVESADAVSVWLRYQTQCNLYVFQIDRTNNGVVASHAMEVLKDFCMAFRAPLATFRKSRRQKLTLF